MTGEGQVIVAPSWMKDVEQGRKVFRVYTQIGDTFLCHTSLPVGLEDGKITLSQRLTWLDFKLVIQSFW